MMTTRNKWWDANWHLHDYAMRRISRLEAFRRMCRAGLTRREAAEMIQTYEREP